MAVEVRTNSQIHKLIFVIDTRSIVERLPMKPLLSQARSQACFKGCKIVLEESRCTKSELFYVIHVFTIELIMCM